MVNLIKENIMKRIIYLLSFIFLLSTLSIRAQEEQAEGAQDTSPEHIF